MRSHCLAVLVANEPGALARIIGLFSGRGYNIESLAVAEVDATHKLSRVTIVTRGTDTIVAQIMAQLGRLVPVRKVVDLGVVGAKLEREMALVKMDGQDARKRAEALTLAESLGGHAVGAAASPMMLQLVAKPEDIDAALRRLASLGMVEVVRTGTIAIGTGHDTL